MLEKLIEQLAVGQSLAIKSAEEAARHALQGNGLVHLPSDYTRHDVEFFMPTRRRMRGTLTTSAIKHFAAYAKAHAGTGASVFIDAEKMQATAVLNLGSQELPGHCDHLAVLVAKRTAAYQALRKAANGMPLSQQAVAEFCEDWRDVVACSADDSIIETKHAIAAIRKITVEGLRKVESEEQKLSATRSTFESVKASSTENLPTTIKFTCEPYSGLSARSFGIRLGVLTSDKPAITLRIVNVEAHEEEMANELANLIRAAFGSDWDNRVLLGTHTSK